MPEVAEQSLALLDARGSGDDWRIEVLAELCELIEVLADDEDLVVRVLVDEFFDKPDLLVRA